MVTNSKGDKYLVVYDGIKDGIASDPILLASHSDRSSSGGGCSTGFSAAALLIAVGLAFRKRD